MIMYKVSLMHCMISSNKKQQVSFFISLMGVLGMGFYLVMWKVIIQTLTQGDSCLCRGKL